LGLQDYLGLHVIWFPRLARMGIRARRSYKTYKNGVSTFAQITEFVQRWASYDAGINTFDTADVRGLPCTHIISLLFARSILMESPK
jgi:hypothetical protein